jgi:hypothetical protein
MRPFIFLLTFLPNFLLAQAPAVPPGIAYQTMVRDVSGQPMANQAVAFRFNIRQNAPNGLPVYSETHTLPTNPQGLVALTIGSGTTLDDFGLIPWSDGPLFLQVEMDPTGGANYQLMSTTQLVSVPYAFYAGRAASVDNLVEADGDPANELQQLSLNGTELGLTAGNSVDLAFLQDADPSPTNELQTLTLTGSTLGLSGANSVTLPQGGSTLNGAYNFGGPGAGRTIAANSGAVNFATSTANAILLDLDHTGTGVALAAENTVASNGFSTVQATTNSTSNLAAAVIGNSTGAAWGVSGQVQANATAQAAVYGSNLRTGGGHGVFGQGFNGMVGQTNYSAGFGVFGENLDQLGNPATDLGVGVAGLGYYGVLGENRYLGQAVTGAYGLFANGDLAATGAKSFCIDHPLDPANKILRHFSLESDEVLNVYRGNAMLDAQGRAVVTLPDYFSAINRNVSYQLTPIGASANLYIESEVADNRFVVAGGQPGLKFSWTLTAERSDAYFQQFPERAQPEIDKREGEKGRYYIPALYGADPSLRLLPIRPTTPKQTPQPIKR